MSRIPFIQLPWWSTDQIAVSQMSTSLIDGMVEIIGENKPVLRQRPGLREQCNPNTNSPGQGCYYSLLLDEYLFVSDGLLFKYDNSAIGASLLSSDFHATNTVIFAEGQDLDSTPVIYMADGTSLKYYKSGTVTVVTNPDAPTTATHVCWFNNRFIVNDSGLYFYATGVNPASGEFDNYYWSSAFNPFIAEYKADNLDFVGALNGALWCWGKESLEIWSDDGITPLVPVPSYSSEIGLVAKYSPVAVGDSYFALIRTQGEIKVAAFTNSSPTPISNAISKQLNSYSVVEDAIGFYVFTGGSSFYVLSFPTENVTWAFDIKGQYWAKWGFWNPETGSYERYLGQYSSYAENWGMFLVQSKNDSRIYAASRTYYQDAGNTLRMEYTSGNIDHGSSNLKQSKQLSFHVKSDQNDIAEFSIRTRDDGRLAWGSEITVGLSFADQDSAIAQLFRMGMYRSRQYQIIATCPVNLVFFDVDENVVVLND